MAEAGLFFAATSIFMIAYATARLGTGVGSVYFISRYRTLGQHGADPRLGAGRPAAGGCRRDRPGRRRLVGAPWLVDTMFADPGPGAVDTLRILLLFVPLAAASDFALAACRGFGTMRPLLLVERLGRNLLQVLGVGLAAVSRPVGHHRAAAGLGDCRTCRRRWSAWSGWRCSSGGPSGRSTRRSPMRARVPAVLALHRAPGAEQPRPDRRAARRHRAARSAAGAGRGGRLHRGHPVPRPRPARRAGAVDGGAAPARRAPGPRRPGGRRRGSTRPRPAGSCCWPGRCTCCSRSSPSRCCALFGEGYEAGRWVTVYLALTMLVATGCGMVDTVLNMAGKTAWTFYNALAGDGRQRGGEPAAHPAVRHLRGGRGLVAGDPGQ